MLDTEKDMNRVKGEDNAVYLTFDEVRILLYSLGYRSCEGVFMPEKEFTQQEILSAMFDMSRKGLLYLSDRDSQTKGAGGPGEIRPEDSGDSFRIREDVSRMLQVMGNPSGTMIYRPGETQPGYSPDYYDGPEFFCYIVPDYVLVAEKDWTRRESLRLRGMDMDSFSAWKDEREQEALQRMFGREDDFPGTAGQADAEAEGQKTETPDKEEAGEIQVLPGILL